MNTNEVQYEVPKTKQICEFPSNMIKQNNIVDKKKCEKIVFQWNTEMWNRCTSDNDPQKKKTNKNTINRN